jgi:peptidoglycan/LPS O-acetylase OafA/YrhL
MRRPDDGRGDTRVPGSPLLSLTSLRFFAAFGVLLFHIAGQFAIEQTGSALAPVGSGAMFRVTKELLNAAQAGSLGPNLFFVLSGFVLYWAYVSTGRLRRDGTASFFVARVARLYPLYLVALALGLLTQMMALTCATHLLECTRGQSGVTVATAVVAQHGWLPWQLAANPPAWTLSVEFLFYLCFPLLVLAIRRLSPLATWLVLGGALIATQSWLVLGAIGPGMPVNAYDGSFASKVWWLVHFAPLFRLPEFVAGLALGRLFSLGRLPRLSSPTAVAVTLASCICVLAMGRVLPHVTGIDVATFANLGGYDVFFCLIIASLASSDVRALSGVALVALGEASYALYILHWPVWYLLADLSPFDLHQVRPFLAWSALYLCVMVVISLLSVRYFERPARRAIQSWWNRRPHSRLQPR